MQLPQLSVLLSLSALMPAILAAECGSTGLCGLVKAATRNQLYAARQHVCGDTDLWKKDGCYTANGGLLRWPGGNSQQICWDAFENILNQCHPEGAGLHYHSGTWNWNGRLYFVHGCSNASC
ncbi:hypothetical protein BP5796_07552 [Coleophoma crateriformis]|uniref:Cyanovirin-N domain-containing protein n=1 Tax=Coleophoma crateriformis TaxID=565419 RepID=A0A3D8RJF9_9HELO|nr:hypothetical protein BP5796_07552 [Coleophoma crateriformis]